MATAKILWANATVAISKMKIAAKEKAALKSVSSRIQRKLGSYTMSSQKPPGEIETERERLKLKQNCVAVKPQQRKESVVHSACR